MSMKFLITPPKFEEINQLDFSVKPTADVDLSLQISEEQDFTANSKNPRITPSSERFSPFKNPLNIIDPS
jgi:hypothetical protein